MCSWRQLAYLDVKQLRAAGAVGVRQHCTRTSIGSTSNTSNTSSTFSPPRHDMPSAPGAPKPASPLPSASPQHCFPSPAVSALPFSYPAVPARPAPCSWRPRPSHAFMYPLAPTPSGPNAQLVSAPPPVCHPLGPSRSSQHASLPPSLLPCLLDRTCGRLVAPPLLGRQQATPGPWLISRHLKACCLATLLTPRAWISRGEEQAFAQEWNEAERRARWGQSPTQGRQQNMWKQRMRWGETVGERSAASCLRAGWGWRQRERATHRSSWPSSHDSGAPLPPACSSSSCSCAAVARG